MKKKSISKSRFNLYVPICLVLYAMALGARPTTITVTNSNGSGPGSLRQALADANDGDTIEFAVTGTIGLTSSEPVIDESSAYAKAAARQVSDWQSAASRSLTQEQHTVGKEALTKATAL